MREHTGRPKRSGPGAGWRGRLRAWINPAPPPRSGRYAAHLVPRTPHHDSDAAHGDRGHYASQERRRSERVPYVIAFVVMIAVLIALSYVGLDWATGRGRVLGLGATATPRAAPTPSPVPMVSSPSATPVEERVYVVKAGDIPEDIARQFDVSVDALLRENGIKDPRKLQVGQTLKIPPSGTR